MGNSGGWDKDKEENDKQIQSHRGGRTEEEKFSNMLGVVSSKAP